jgi:hypothetical protein
MNWKDYSTHPWRWPYQLVRAGFLGFLALGTGLLWMRHGWHAAPSPEKYVHLALGTGTLVFICYAIWAFIVERGKKYDGLYL